MISADRLARAAAYADSLRERVYLVVEERGIRVSSLASRNFASKTVSWADLAAPGALKKAIDGIANEMRMRA